MMTTRVISRLNEVTEAEFLTTIREYGFRSRRHVAIRNDER
jgi:hypothetical protein